MLQFLPPLSEYYINVCSLNKNRTIDMETAISAPPPPLDSDPRKPPPQTIWGTESSSREAKFLFHVEGPFRSAEDPRLRRGPLLTMVPYE
ncbi:hypothetical protein AVEN_101062-1 [Araneus ventricosus]|uniref:Uncharacterized protein n=1 Tax=Araneus ventricosus TaxID=182803 RepID=A0A4Y2FWB4_ARAVE|nr:hypothetical protein AVEN_101062-1 [Araneus ventricosus]